MDKGNITDVQLGAYRIYTAGVGDTWDPAWAEDGALYSPGNDGSGWDKACSANVFFNKNSGEDFLELSGKTVSGMPEYGGWAERGADGRTWKSSGCLCLDGVLYLALGRHKYGTDSGDPYFRQTVERTSIIKSTDKGATWSRPAAENYKNAMFPGPRFSTPYFIHYGRDGQAPALDGAEKYIYALSNNGFWCNGDNYVLGRVAREKLWALRGDDWEFHAGGDGMNEKNWSRHAEDARPVIADPLKCGETGATYLAPLKRYCLVAWDYPGNPTIDTDETRFSFWEAPHPWGPWTKIKEVASKPEGWYCPRILAKWQRGNENEAEGVLVTGGDYYELGSYYRFTVVPLKLKRGGRCQPVACPPPARVVLNTDKGSGLYEVEYTGEWKYDNARAKASSGGEHYSSQVGASFAVRFEGKRLKWYASKEGRLGLATASLDGGKECPVDLSTYCTSPQYNRLVFDSGPLASGQHTFKVQVDGGKALYSKQPGVCHDRVEIEGGFG